jgi:hypothetical protein
MCYFFFNLVFIFLIWIFVFLPFCTNFISFQFHPSIQIYSILIFFNFILILFIFLVLLLKLFFFSISPFNQRFIVFISFIFYFYPLSSHYYFFGSFHIILFFSQFHNSFLFSILSFNIWFAKDWVCSFFMYWASSLMTWVTGLKT